MRRVRNAYASSAGTNYNAAMNGSLLSEAPASSPRDPASGNARIGLAPNLGYMRASCFKRI